MNNRRTPDFFNFGNRKENIIACQLRNDASNLNYDLWCHHLTDDPRCSHCGDVNEDKDHFILSCPRYAVYRAVLQNVCGDLGVDLNVHNVLYGSDSLDFDDNITLTSALHTYIKDCRRFI